MRLSRLCCFAESRFGAMADRMTGADVGMCGGVGGGGGGVGMCGGVDVGVGVGVGVDVVRSPE